MKKYLHAKTDPKECPKSHQICYRITTKPWNYGLLPARCQTCKGCETVRKGLKGVQK